MICVGVHRDSETISHWIEVKQDHLDSDDYVRPLRPTVNISWTHQSQRMSMTAHFATRRNENPCLVVLTNPLLQLRERRLVLFAEPWFGVFPRLEDGQCCDAKNPHRRSCRTRVVLISRRSCDNEVEALGVGLGFRKQMGLVGHAIIHFLLFFRISLIFFYHGNYSIDC